MSGSTQRRQEIMGGFSLVELLIAIALSGIVLASISSVFVMQNKSYKTEELVAEMQQNARSAMDIMTREIRMAGYGTPKSSISSWVDWVTGVTMDSNPKIVQGSGSNPDTIYIAGCFDVPLATLSTAASSGATSLVLQNTTQASQFTTDKKKLISINGLENAVITGISGSTLTIDTNPTTTGNQGLARNHAAGTPLYLVRVITYSIDTNTLKRNENTGGGSQPLAENLQDLQISQSGKTINLSLTARTSAPDPNYTANGGYRTRTLTSSILPRNLAY